MFGIEKFDRKKIRFFFFFFLFAKQKQNKTFCFSFIFDFYLFCFYFFLYFLVSKNVRDSNQRESFIEKKAKKRMTWQNFQDFCEFIFWMMIKYEIGGKVCVFVCKKM